MCYCGYHFLRESEVTQGRRVMESTGRIHCFSFEEEGKASPSISNRSQFLFREEGNKKSGGNDRFDPGKYGMVICDACNGTGKSSNGPEEGDVCSTCGGFGLTKKEG
jgi:hypothetical protein